MKKLVINILTIASIIFQIETRSQETKEASISRKFFGIEGSSSILFTSSPKFEFIRGDVLPYSSGGVSDMINGKMIKNHVGIKAEFRSKSNQWGLLIGLRYSQLNLYLGRNELYGATTKYFYVLDHQTGTTTEYFRVREISRKIDFIGTAIEVRWLSKSPKLLKPYVKFGAEFDSKVQHSDNVVFHNQSMQDYKERIVNKFDNVSSFNSSIYFAGGVNLDKKPDIDLEIILPYILLTPEMSGILKPKLGLGAKLELRIPL
jgi:hypothetical protein